MKLYQPTFTCINGNTADPRTIKCLALYWMYNLRALPTSAICNVQKQQEQAWTQKIKALVALNGNKQFKYLTKMGKQDLMCRKEKKKKLTNSQ